MPLLAAVLLQSALVAGPSPATETPAEAPATESAALAATAAPDAEGPFRRREWTIHFAPGFDYFTFETGGVRLNAMGGGFRFGGHKSYQKGGFYIAGGPILHYTYLQETGKAGPADKLHLATVNADMFIGGGGKKVLGYGHLTFGLGVLSGEDGETGDRITLPGIRGAVGAGVHGYVHDRISVGALVDVGWAGVGLWINPMVTLNFHFPIRKKK